MPSNASFDLYCEVWKPENFTEKHSSSTHPQFFIDLYVSSYIADRNQVTRITFYKNFRQRSDHLTHDSISWSTISSMLSETNVPYHLHPFFIQQISTRARDIASEPENESCKIIPIVVDVIVPDGAVEELDDSEVVRESMEASRVSGFVRASKMSIKMLERVRVEGFEKKRCVICLEEIVVGSNASVMPCLHFYHQSCIENWLEKSNLCPLCRFQMPVEEA